MTKDEAVDKLYAALSEVEQIDLRGRKSGTPLHTATTTVRISLLDAIELLEEED